jgi:hypothetical protein
MGSQAAWTLPAELALAAGRNGSDIVVSWPSFPGGVYQVMIKEELGTVATVRTNEVRAVSTHTRLLDPMNQTNQFYAVLQQPVRTASGPVNSATVRELESLAGVSFSDAQREQVLRLLTGGVPFFAEGEMLSLKGWDQIRKWPLRNENSPALVFDPRPTGFVLPTGSEPHRWSEVGARLIGSPASAPLAFLAVPELAVLIRSGQVTSTELTKMYLERLKKYNPVLHCVITLTEELALQKAQQADEEIAAGKYRGVLHGIPYGLKDLFAVKGYPTTWGAEAFRDQVIETNSAVYQRLDEAGAVLVAKLSLARVEALGGTPVSVRLPEYPAAAMLSIFAVEAAAAFDELTRSGGLELAGGQFAFDLPNIIRTARMVSAVDYLQADRVRRQLLDELARLWEEVDVWVGSFAVDTPLALANLAGLPSVSIPHGGESSLVFVGQLYGEGTVLECAKAYQDATAYHREVPPHFLN